MSKVEGYFSKKLNACMALYGFDRLRISRDSRIFISKRLDDHGILRKNEDVFGKGIVEPIEFISRLRTVKGVQEKHEVSIEAKLEMIREAFEDAKRQFSEMLDQIYRGFCGEAAVSLLALTSFRGLQADMASEGNDTEEEEESQARLKKVELFMKEVETLVRHLSKEESHNHCIDLLSRLERANTAVNSVLLDVSKKLEEFTEEQQNRSKIEKNEVKNKGKSKEKEQKTLEGKEKEKPRQMGLIKASSLPEAQKETQNGDFGKAGGTDFDLVRAKHKPKEIIVKAEVKSIFSCPITGAGRGMVLNIKHPQTAFFLTEEGHVQNRELFGKHCLIWKKQLSLGRGNNSHYNCIALSPDCNHLAVSGASNCSIHVMSAKGESLRVISCQDVKTKSSNPQEKLENRPEIREIWRILFVDDQNLLVSFNTGRLTFYNILTGIQLRTKQYSLGSFETLALLSSGRIAGGSTKGFVALINVSLYDHIEKKIHEDRVIQLKSSKNGKIMASASRDKTIALLSATGSFRMYWALRTIEVVREMEFDPKSDFLLLFYGPDEPREGRGWLSLIEVATGFQLAKIVYDQSPLSICASWTEQWEFIAGDGAGKGLCVFRLEEDF